MDLNLMSKKRNILVTGSPRSGTTWVGKTLGQLPSTDYIDEPFNADGNGRFADNSMKYYARTWFLHAPGSAEEEPMRKALEARIRQTNLPWLNAYEVCKTRGLISVQTPVRFTRHLLLRTFQPKRLLIKDPIAIFSAPWLHENFDMDVVCTIRNPLAFAGSMKKWGWSYPFDHLARQEQFVENRLSKFAGEINEFASNPKEILEKACLWWNCFYHVIAQYQAEYPNWAYVRHEDLVQNPVDGYKGICEQINIEFTDSVRSWITEMTSDSGPSDVNSPAFQKRDATEVVSSWQKRLSPEDVQYVIRSTEETAGPFYQVNGDRYE